MLAVGMCLVSGWAEAACKRTDVTGADRHMPVNGSFNQTLLDAAILAEANYYRCKSNLKPLQSLTVLRDPAKGHSDWMAKKNKLSHKSNVRGLRTLKDRVNSTGLVARSAAENLAYLPLFDLTKRFRIVDSNSCLFASLDGKRLKPHSYESFAQKVVLMWMNSPGHRKNLLSRSTSHMAAAATLRPERKSCGNVYVTQLFVG